jgi:hypothetical protein
LDIYAIDCQKPQNAKIYTSKMTAEFTETFMLRKEKLVDKKTTREAMEIDENYTNTTAAETSDQHINVNSKIDQKENNATNRLPRKEFRKLMKKQRKKNARIEAAKAKQQEQEEREEETPEEVMEAIKAEEKKRFDILNKIDIIMIILF